MTNKDLMLLKKGLNQFKYGSMSKEELRKELLLKAQKSKSDIIKSNCYWCLSEITENNDERLLLLYLSAHHGGIEASIRLLSLLCGLDRLAIRKFNKEIRNFQCSGVEFSNPMEYLKYNGYKYMNILIVLAYFALTVDKDEQKALNYMYDFASSYGQDIIESDSEGLYNSCGFQYYDINFEDSDHFIWNKTKTLFELLKDKQNLNDEFKFTYAIFLYGAICSIFEDDYSNQINKAVDIIKELCKRNQKDAIYFALILSSYSPEYKEVLFIYPEHLLLLGESNDERIYPYIAFHPSIEESVRVRYLKKYINNKSLDSFYDWMIYLPTLFKELKEDHEDIWGDFSFNAWCYSEDFLNHLDNYLTNQEINSVIDFLIEREDQYDYEGIQSKYKIGKR